MQYYRTKTGSPLGVLLVSFGLVQHPDTINVNFPAKLTFLTLLCTFVLCSPQASTTILVWEYLERPCLSILKASLVLNHRSYAQKGIMNIVENEHFIESIKKYWVVGRGNGFWACFWINPKVAYFTSGSPGWKKNFPGPKNVIISFLASRCSAAPICWGNCRSRICCVVASGPGPADRQSAVVISRWWQQGSLPVFH